MASLQSWVSAARPRTLPLAVAGLLLGNLLAAADGLFHPLIAVLSVLTATFLQVLSNFANDYGDFKNGADNEHRIGPKRSVQSGEISERAMKNAIILFASMAFVSGLGLLYYASFKIGTVHLLTMLGLGFLSILAAYRYTASKNPYGYKGYGDIAVFVFFGLLAVAGIYFLQTGTISSQSLFMGAAFGALSTGVLNLNNMRDIENDANTGKITVAVRLGLPRAKRYHYILISSAVIIFILFAAIRFQTVYQYLFLTPILLLITHCVKVNKRTTYADFNPLLKELSLSSALTALSTGIAIII
ncbi:1,4-dihydroxy-2-naphthoate octaprenyltransferase [bacterium]|nr:1,4-dihydroxy-2-naphthoate octaprenyltransferase [bacterium]